MLEVVLYTLEVLEGVRYAPLCILEDVEGVLWWLEEIEVTSCVLLCMLEAVESVRILELLEAMRYVL